MLVYNHSGVVYIMNNNELTLEDKTQIRAYNLFYINRLDLKYEFLKPKIQYMTFY